MWAAYGHTPGGTLENKPAQGFKSAQAFSDNVKTNSGTVSRWAQRAINMHAAPTGYTMLNMGI